MEAEVSGAAWWAFGLGLASVFTCGLLGILGPFAIWLGVGANRRGGGPVAVAGIVFGILGTLILIVWLLVFALVGYFDVRPPTHTLLPLMREGHQRVIAMTLAPWRWSLAPPLELPPSSPPEPERLALAGKASGSRILPIPCRGT